MLYLLCAFLSYIAGIFLSTNILEANPTLLILFILILIVINFSFYYFKRINLFLITFISLIFCYFGANWYQYWQEKPKNNDLYYYANDQKFNKVTVEGIIADQPKVAIDKISFQFIPKIVSKPETMLTSGKVQVFIYSSKLKLNYGDNIQLSGKLTLPAKAANPNEFDYSAFLHKSGIFTTITANSENDVKVLESKTLRDFQYYLIEIKNRLLATFYENMPEDSASLVSSLVFGSKASPVPKEVQDDFVNLGLAHVLAASGMQISLLMSLGLLITKKLKINPIVGNSLTALTIIFYMFITGLPPSILRAGLVNLLILVVAHKNQKLDSLRALFVVSFILILYNPVTLFDIGFQFSVLATFGLLYASPVLKEKFEFLPDFFAEIIAMIIAAQLIVMPLQLLYFGQFSYLFLPANIIASLLVDLLTYLAIITLTFGLIIPFIAYYLGKILFYFVSFLVYSVSLLADLPYAVSYISRPDIFSVIFMYSLIFILLELLKLEYFEISKIKNLKFYLLISIFIGSFSYIIYDYFIEKSYLSVLYANVGQGDGSLIKTPSGKNILIDCGQAYQIEKDGKVINYNAAEKYLIPYFRHNGIKRIDMLIITHPDLDHIGGCESILNNFDVLSVWDAGQYDESKPYSQLFENILKKEIPIRVVNKGDSYKENNFNLEVINDIDVKATDAHSYNNNNAIALKLTYDKTSFLFMADIEKESEDKLINSGVDLNSGILKIGHHGSKTSSSDEFISMVRPQISVISVGKNRYGHPSKDVIERLESFGSKVYRTDKSGGVIIKTNGNKIQVVTSN